MKNRVISILTIIALIVNLVPITITYAASPISLSIVGDKTKVQAGDTVNYTVKCNATGKISSLSFTLDIPEGMTYKENSGEVSTQLIDLQSKNFRDFMDISFTEGKKLFVFLPNEPYDLSGITELLTFQCTVNNDASGTQNIGLSGLEVVDEDIETVPEEEVQVVEKEPVVVNVPTTGISLDKSSLTIENGKSERLIATVTPDNATDKTVTWSSSDESVATVSNGSVSAKKKGTATITATAADGQKATCTVTVTQPITGITLNKSSLELSKGETETLKATVLPSDADGDKTVEWSSNNERVATVSSNGMVTAVAKGSATITAKVDGKEATCTVTVGVPLNSISLNENEKELNRGETLQLEVTYNPEDTDADKTVTWSSLNDSVATVSNSGLVETKGAGETTITASVAGKTATCKISVVVPIESVTIKHTTQFKVGESDKLSATINPEDTTMDKTIEWTSSDESVATVSTDGTIKGVGIGTATVTAKTINGKTDTCNVEVLPIPLNSIALEQNISLNKDDTKKLEVTFVPEDTTDDKTVEWSSSDDSIVSVSTDGTITAKAKGTATITAKVGEKEATTDVTVTVNLKSITLNETSKKLEKDGEEDFTLVVTLNPEDTSEQPTIVWSSSNESVATVDQNGKVTPIKGGTTYIKAKVDGKDIEAQCEVNVVVPLTGIKVDKTGMNDPAKLLKGQSMELAQKVKAIPEDTTDAYKLTYSSSDESVAKVDANGKVTGVKDGLATITITAKIDNSRRLARPLLGAPNSESGEFTTTLDIDVDEIPIDSVVINKTDFELKKNKQERLTATINPENTTDEDKTVHWTSSDESIATVNASGIVLAVDEGTATITATVGTKSASVKVTVVPVIITSVSLDGTSVTTKIGSPVEIKTTVGPKDITEPYELTYASSDSDVIKVNEDGTIMAVGLGKAILSVSAGDGIEDQIEIEVVEQDNIDTNKDDEETETPEISNEEEKTDKSSAKSNGPQTGDINLGLYVALMLASSIGIAYIFIKNRKK